MHHARQDACDDPREVADLSPDDRAEYERWSGSCACSDCSPEDTFVDEFDAPNPTHPSAGRRRSDPDVCALVNYHVTAYYARRDTLEGRIRDALCQLRAPALPGCQREYDVGYQRGLLAAAALVESALDAPVPF